MEKFYLELPSIERENDAIEYIDDFYDDFDKEKALKMIDRFQLPLKQNVKSMSKGMQEKLQLVLVMSRRAKLSLLDEPIAGVDPAAREFILKNSLESIKDEYDYINF